MEEEKARRHHVQQHHGAMREFEAGDPAADIGAENVHSIASSSKTGSGSGKGGAGAVSNPE